MRLMYCKWSYLSCCTRLTCRLSRQKLPYTHNLPSPRSVSLGMLFPAISRCTIRLFFCSASKRDLPPSRPMLFHLRSVKAVIGKGQSSVCRGKHKRLDRLTKHFAFTSPSASRLLFRARAWASWEAPSWLIWLLRRSSCVNAVLEARPSQKSEKASAHKPKAFHSNTSLQTVNTGEEQEQNKPPQMKGSLKSSSEIKKETVHSLLYQPTLDNKLFNSPVITDPYPIAVWCFLFFFQCKNVIYITKLHTTLWKELGILQWSSTTVLQHTSGA